MSKINDQEIVFFYFYFYALFTLVLELMFTYLLWKGANTHFNGNGKVAVVWFCYNITINILLAATKRLCVLNNEWEVYGVLNDKPSMCLLTLLFCYPVAKELSEIVCHRFVPALLSRIEHRIEILRKTETTIKAQIK